MNSILLNGKEGRKPDINSSLRRLRIMLRNLDKNAVQDFHLWSELQWTKVNASSFLFGGKGGDEAQ